MGTVDKEAERYERHSPYAYVLNRPTVAIDPDGKRVYFVGGANNDQDGWNYIERWGNTFRNAGILQAQAALKLANSGQVIDNLILIGSPISDKSDLPCLPCWLIRQGNPVNSSNPSAIFLAPISRVHDNLSPKAINISFL